MTYIGALASAHLPAYITRAVGRAVIDQLTGGRGVRGVVCWTSLQ